MILLNILHNLNNGVSFHDSYTKILETVENNEEFIKNRSKLKNYLR